MKTIVSINKDRPLAAWRQIRNMLGLKNYFIKKIQGFQI